MRCLVAATLVALAATPARAADGRSRLIVLPVEIDADVHDRMAGIVEDVILAAVEADPRYDAVGASDLDAMIRLELHKDLLGCSDTVCLAELSGALGGDRSVVVRVTRLGAQWVVSAKLLAVDDAVVTARSIRVATGDEVSLLQTLPETVADLLDSTAGSTPDRVAGVIAAPMAPCGDDLAGCMRRCESGHASSCIRLGNIHLMGKQAPRDWTKAAALYVLACDAGNAGGCTNLAVLTEYGFGLLPDSIVARSLYDPSFGFVGTHSVTDLNDPTFLGDHRGRSNTRVTTSPKMELKTFTFS